MPGAWAICLSRQEIVPGAWAPVYFQPKNTAVRRNVSRFIKILNNVTTHRALRCIKKNPSEHERNVSTTLLIYKAVRTIRYMRE